MISIKELPQTISDLTPEDIELLVEAVRAAGRLPRYMEDPETSFRLGWILGMLGREVANRHGSGSTMPTDSGIHGGDRAPGNGL